MTTFAFPVSQGLDIRRVRKTVTFDGGAGSGAVGTVAMFTTTGRVGIQWVSGYCTDSLTEAAPTATVEVGITGGTALLFVQHSATNIDANTFYETEDATFDNDVVIMTPNQGYLSAVASPIAIDSNVILTVGSQNVTAGTIIFDFWWFPISDGATLVAA